jgi:hypothetical protein
MLPKWQPPMPDCQNGSKESLNKISKGALHNWPIGYNVLHNQQKGLS